MSKLKSRKFLMSLIGTLSAIAIALGADEEIVKVVMAVAAVVLPAIYTAVEGSIDKAALFTTAKEVIDIVDGSKEVQSIEESTEEIAETVSGEEE